ncbi:MAG: GNAT family N-acetyltransferase [Planctomycetota bacterium]
MTIDDLLERTQWDFFWVPADVAIVDRAEILYVTSPRDHFLFNQVTRTRAAAARIPALVEEVAAVHAGRRSRWLVRESIERGPLEAELARAGYAAKQECFACALAVADHRPRPAPGITVLPVDSRARLLDCIAVANRAFAEPRPVEEEDLRRQLAECASPGARVHRFVAYDEATGAAIASGGLTLFPALRFGFLWAGATVPEARGRGAYSAVLAARVRRAAERGIDRVGLYAIPATSAPVVLRQGFSRHGTMTYWDRPAC